MKTKLIISALTFSLAVTPKLLFLAATNYTHLYLVSADYTERKIATLLKTLNLQTIPSSENLENTISKIAAEYNLSPHFIAALIKHESSTNPAAHSPKGAIGLMQIMPANAKRCGLKSASELWNEETNIRCGTQIISEEISVYKGDIYKALLAYNGGTKAVTGNYPESLNHAKEVLRLYAMNSVKPPKM